MGIHLGNYLEIYSGNGSEVITSEIVLVTTCTYLGNYLGEYLCNYLGNYLGNRPGNDLVTHVFN